MDYSETVPKWVKFGNVHNLVFVGKDVIASASGLYVKFYHMNTKEERVERFNSQEKGEGASCLAGHPVVPMFAIAERRPNPRVLILTYPKLKRVTACVVGGIANAAEYLASAFLDTEYLVTLSSIPHFEIIVWLWRTGEKLAAKHTKITDPLQRLSCSVTSPRCVSQLSLTSGKLIVYEISVCSKIVTLIPVEMKRIENENLVSVSWTADGAMLLCDEVGNVTWMSGDGERRYVAVRGGGSNELAGGVKRPTIAAFQGGVILVNVDSKIIFYKKPPTDKRQSEALWRVQWEVKAVSHPTAMAVHPLRNNILFHGERGDLFEVFVGEDNLPRVNATSSQGAGYEMFTWIYPGVQGIVTVDKFRQITVLEPITGEYVGKLSLADHGEVLCMTPHPDSPIIAIGTSIGECLLVNLFLVAKPIILTSFHLQREPLDKIRYSYTGKTLGLASSCLGQFFFLRGKPGDRFHVFSHLKIDRQVADFLLYEHDGGLKLLVLIVTSTCAVVGDIIMTYTLKNGQEIFRKENYVIELLNTFKSLHFGARNSSNVIGVPYLTKQLHLMEIQDDFEGIRVIQALPSGHQLRNARIYVDRHHVVTASYDGLVIVRDGANLAKVIAVHMPHHRQQAGVKFALASPCGDMIVSLGQNGNLVSSKLSYAEPDLQIVFQANIKLASPSMQQMFTDPTGGFAPDIEDEGKTWIECQETMKFRMECQTSKAAKVSIMDDFRRLRSRIAALLDANEKATAEERVPIADFYLDGEMKERILLEAREDRMNAEANAVELMQRQDKIAAFLRKTCWQSDPMVVDAHARSVKAIFGNMHVDNYPLLATNQEQRDKWRWTEYVRNLSDDITKLDASYVRSQKTDSLLGGELEKVGREEEFDLTGTTTDRWVLRGPQHLSQLEMYNYTLGTRESVFIQQEIYKLKDHFNNLFGKIVSEKECEMTMVGKQIRALRHDAHELQTMFQVNFNDKILQLPIWDPMERPETIITVEDWEVEAKPYVSSSQQDEWDEKIAETERIHKSLSNDHFREQALMDMMDGVLETRWEDEIKKDIPKPACLLEKDPSDYTEEEINAVAVYEKKVRQLTTEREKYKSLLESDFKKITGDMNDGIRKFNERLDAFFVEKMKLESAILQEKLSLLRTRRRELEKTRSMEEITNIQDKQLIPAVRRAQKISEELSLLEETVAEMKNRYETLCKREKMLECKFRGEFPELKPPMVEHLSRHYKRRPRIGPLTCTSITYLTEIERCVLSGEKPEILPRECMDFLKGMDSLDIMPNNLPIQIDSSHWQTLCKLRRIKVEVEMRLKCCAVEVAEAEQTVASYQKLYSTWQNRISQVKETLREHRVARLRYAEDTEVQLVLKMGQVEARLHGRTDDLAAAVFMSAKQLCVLNEAIIKAGKVKLTAMKKTVDSRRGILCKEWQHRRMDMALRDMREELYVLKNVKVTKEIQDHMKRRNDNAKGRDIKNVEKEAGAMKRRFQKLLDAEKYRLDKLMNEIDHWGKENAKLNLKIQVMNNENCEESLRLRVRGDALDKEEQFTKDRIEALMKRNRLVKTVQDNYNQLLILQTELELLRLKTYPTLRFK